MSSIPPKGQKPRTLQPDDLLVSITAILMAVARADGKIDRSETEEILGNLITHNRRGYKIEELQQIMSLAESISSEPPLLLHAVKIASNYLSPQQQQELLLLTKSVAYADGVVTTEEREKIIILAKRML